MKYVSHEWVNKYLFVTIKFRRWYFPWSTYTRTALYLCFDLSGHVWTWTDSGKYFRSNQLKNMVKIAEAEEQRLEQLTA